MNCSGLFCMRLLADKLNVSMENRRDFWQRIVDYSDSISQPVKEVSLARGELSFLFDLVERVSDRQFNRDKVEVTNLKVQILCTIYSLLRNSAPRQLQEHQEILLENLLPTIERVKNSMLSKSDSRFEPVLLPWLRIVETLTLRSIIIGDKKAEITAFLQMLSQETTCLSTDTQFEISNCLVELANHKNGEERKEW